MNIRVNPKAKLKLQEVVEIISAIKRGGISNRKLGKKYGTTDTNISSIRRGLTWKRVHLALEKKEIAINT